LDQLDRLWEYQQEDMANDRLDNDMKNAPSRVKFLKSREYLAAQRDTLKRIEAEVAEMADRIDIVKDAITKLDDQVAAMHTRFEEELPSSLEDTRGMLQDAKHIFNGVSAYESEMKKLKRDAEECDRQRSEIRPKAARAIAEYEELKKIYEEESKEKNAVLEEKRSLTALKEKDIDIPLLEKYRVIKTRCVPPVVKLFADQCGGCNMSLPSVILKKIKNRSEVVECETCGRIIIS